MTRTRQLQMRKTTEVLISDKAVFASEMERVIPEGYRQATLKETILGYRHDARFRRELRFTGRPAWTSQKGLDSCGYYEIKGDGRQMYVAYVTGDRFWNELKPEQRAYHDKGSGPVFVKVNYSGVGMFLSIIASAAWADLARVAYVKDDRERATAQNTPVGVAVRTGGFKAAKRGN